MDNHGVNVGQSNMTSDYWLGTEAKWQTTLLIGLEAIHISDDEFDESSQTYQARVSVSIYYPQRSVVVGAVTLAVNTVAAEIYDGNTDLSSRTEQQEASLEKTSVALEEIVATASKNPTIQTRREC